jgi:tRNA threonylcarbamoyladenosine biosynthesis protein TsaE
MGAARPAARAGAAIAMTRDELVAWGERFGATAQAPCVVALRGDLGAGKTTLAQAICRGYGVTEAVTSPTYTLVHEYAAPRSPVYHLDLYRLAGESALTNIGWDEIAGADALVLVEWPERAGSRLPPDVVTISLAHCADDADRRSLAGG